MFCPKCGASLPDGSQFCGQCGSQLKANEASAAASPSAQGGKSRQQKGFSPLSGSAANSENSAYVAIALAAAAVVASLLPWLEVDSVVSALSGAAAGAASSLGFSGVSDYAFGESYSLWSMPSLAGTIERYASLGAAFGNSSADAGMGTITLTAWICFITWIGSVVLLGLGSYELLRKGDIKKFKTGGTMLLFCIAAFYVLVGMLDGFATANVLPTIACMLLDCAAFGWLKLKMKKS